METAIIQDVYTFFHLYSIELSLFCGSNTASGSEGAGIKPPMNGTALNSGLTQSTMLTSVRFEQPRHILSAAKVYKSLLETVCVWFYLVWR